MAEINTIDKLEHRIMGEYSIAKSFKGILRIAHIKDVSSDATNTDEFLNPTFYGNPTDLMDISGKESSKQSAGYANAIKALQGGLSRYNCYTLDKLRLNRVPVTDSMGNYLNWNVGLDGVTIGSNEKINGYSPAKIKIENCTYQELFPVLKTNNLTVGLTKMLLGIDKGSVNDASVILEGATQTPMIVVQNFYDKSDANKSYDENLDEVIDIKIGEEIEGAKDIQIKSKFFKYNEEQLGGYKEYRTIYTNTKENVEDYDVFMYKQDNFDIIDVEDVKNFDIIDGENDKKHHYIHHSKVDVVNLKNYVKKMIDKFMKGNVVEVPTGAVIWQYCSLDKWRAEKESADGDSIDMGNNGYPGHRPPMQQRQYSLQHVNPFYNTTIQGACRKQTYLSGSSQIINNTSDSSESSDMTLTENNSLLDEIIPLYKRDYVLCRLMLMAYVLRRRKEPNFLPLRLGRVMTMSLDTSLLSSASQSMPCLFQSSGSCLPKRMVKWAASLSVVVISRRSFSCRMVSEVGMLTLSSLHRREMTNLRCDHSAICLTFLSKMAGLRTLNVAMYVWSLPSDSAVSISCFLTNSLRTAIIARITPTTPNGQVMAQLRAAPVVGSPSCFNVCWAAPRAGVLVVAPQRIPTISLIGMAPNLLMRMAISVPSRMTPKPSIFSWIPPWRKELKKPGPTCKPSSQTNSTRPKLSA